MKHILKPCPCCGPDHMEALDFHWHDGVVSVECRRCGMRGPGHAVDTWSPYPRAEEEEGKASAAHSWNKLPRRNEWQPI